MAKADQLIGNFTTNLYEVLMHIHSKFDGGKQINIIKVVHGEIAAPKLDYNKTWFSMGFISVERCYRL